MHPAIAVLDFGSQYTQVIARRIRECHVYSKIFNYKTKASELKKYGIQGIILSGGPSSVLSKNAPKPDSAIFKLGIPVLGICYGLQLQGHLLGGAVEKSKHREYGLGHLTIGKESPLFLGIKKTTQVWNSHGDRLSRLPKGYAIIASTENSRYAAIEDEKRYFYGLQFHPEVAHTEAGKAMLENFVFQICKCKPDWEMGCYMKESVQKIRETVGDRNVLLGLSGGVDSSVAAALIHKAIGDQLICLFVDNGLLRLDEREQVETLFKSHFRMKLKTIRAGTRFLKALKGVTHPERKRKIIGKLFVREFENAIKSVGHADFLAQGTLYPDVIESVSIAGNPAATIKTHHNVGGLPKKMQLKLLEPLRELFKDEVRALGAALGLPKRLLNRHPFPGPGLAVRIMGEITPARLRMLRQADAIFIEELENADLYDSLWQAFCVFIPIKTVGVMGDERTYEDLLALRAVESSDAMTAHWAHLPHSLLQRVSNRIINEVAGLNRVVYDVSSKPPSTIEWE